MTKEEAIKELKQIPAHIGQDCEDYELRAIRMAIESLDEPFWHTEEPTEDGEYIFHLNYWDSYAIANITGYLDNGACYDFHDNVIDPKNIEAYYQIPPYEEQK